MELLSKISWEQISLIIIAIFHIAEVIVRLTPTEKDNSILNTIKSVFDKIIPNLSKKGEDFK